MGPKIVQIIPAKNWFAEVENAPRRHLVCWALMQEEPGNLKGGEIVGMVNDGKNTIRATSLSGFKGYFYAHN